MISYLINRWIVARRFEKSGAGYIYRRRPDLPGIPLSEEERQEALREFRRRYWKSWPVLLGGVLAAALTMAVLTVVLNLAESVSRFTGLWLGDVLLVVMLRALGREPLMPEQR